MRGLGPLRRVDRLTSELPDTFTHYLSQVFKQCLLYELYHTERKTENYSQMCVCERERKKERKKDRRRVFLIGLSRWESLRSDAQNDKKQTSENRGIASFCNLYSNVQASKVDYTQVY